MSSEPPEGKSNAKMAEGRLTNSTSGVGSSNSLLGIQIEHLDVDPDTFAPESITPRAGTTASPVPPPPPPIQDYPMEPSTSPSGGSRPPLGPTATPPTRRPQSALRVTSTGSSLSDVSLDYMAAGGRSPGDGRNVSWDMNAPPGSSTQDNLIQEVIDTGGLYASSTPLSLRDIEGDNPVGEEAEATILQALDEQRARSNKRVGSGILSVVPDEAVDIFRGSSDEFNDEFNHTPATLSPKQLGGSSPRGGNRTLKSAVENVVSLNAEQGSRFTELNQLLRKVHEKDEDVSTAPTEQTHRRLRTWSRDPGYSRTESKANNIAGNSLLHNADILFRRSSDASPMGSPRSRKKTEIDHNSADEGELPHEMFTGVGVVGDDEVGNNLEVGGGQPPDDEPPAHLGSKTKKTRISRKVNANKESIIARTMTKAKHGVSEDLKDFGEFLKPRKASIYSYLRILVLFIFFPAVAVAAILFYAAGNPDLGRDCGQEECATISWLILYLVRCGVTFTMARAAEVLLIDYLSLRARFTVKLVGPLATLGIVQSKGFPFILGAWSICNFCLLSGRHRFAMHWLFWQNTIGLFSEENSAGTVTYSKMNYTILVLALIGAISVAVKRFLLGNYFGERTYSRYGDQLAKLMKKILLISKVANHARRIYQFDGKLPYELERVMEYRQQRNGSYDTEVDDMNPRRRRLSTTDSSLSERPALYASTLEGSQKQRVMEILGAFEEPDLLDREQDDASITAMLEFRQALTFMDHDFPFSVAFGPAENRESCVQSAQQVYERLLMRQTEDGSVLVFDTIAELAFDEDDNLNEDMLRDLVRLFRPDRKGHLTVYDLVKSVDAVYKEMRLLRASITNSGQIDRAFETIFNCVFYLVGICIALAALGLSPLALFFSFSSIILAFAFMIGSASSKYFEGILFILLRKPYDIGDRIHVSDVNNSLTTDGTMTWFVEHVNLYSTTVRLAATNEVASYSNGALATSRIINAARSPKAIIYIHFKFSVDVEYSKVQLFKHTITNFIKDRPREWIGALGFRASQVEQSQGFIQYTLAVGHREAWQNIGPILDSKSALSSFGLEVAKKLDMRYRAPPLPVNLAMMTTSSEGPSSEPSEHQMNWRHHSPTPSSLPDVSAIEALFREELKKDK